MMTNSQYLESELGWALELPNLREAVKKKKNRPSLLVVDDDPVFCKTMEAIAKRNNLKIKTVRNIGELFSLPKEHTYDVAILDYDFGEITAYQVGLAVSKDTPILLISNTDRKDVHFSDWPFNVRAFVHKSSGYSCILQTAINVMAPRLRNKLITPGHNGFRWFYSIALLVALSVMAWLSQKPLIATYHTHKGNAPIWWDGNEPTNPTHPSTDLFGNVIHKESHTTHG